MSMAESMLADAFKQRSATQHSVSDALVNTRLLAVVIDRTLYAHALACFYVVLKRIEDLLDKQTLKDSRVRQFAETNSQMYRSAAIAADLEYFLGRDWKGVTSDSNVARCVEPYLIHLETLHDSTSIVAHAYTQWSAFISGGRILASKVISKALGLVHDSNGCGEGLRAFSYEGNTTIMKQTLRESLNCLGSELNDEEFNSMIDEHMIVFNLNNHIVKSFRVGVLASIKAYSKFLLSMAQHRKLSCIIASIGCLVLILVLTKRDVVRER